MVMKRAGKWPAEMERLREILLACDLREERKWGWPCFTLEERNIALIHCFKDYIAVLFFKGALLKDAKGRLSRIGANTQAGRQMRFTGVDEIAAEKKLVTAYVREAIQIELSGAKVAKKPATAYAVPEELTAKLAEDAAFAAAWEALTPGRRNGYLLHFGGAKQAATRVARIERCAPRIFAGHGLLER